MPDSADADAVIVRVAAPFAYHKYPPGETPTGWIAELFAKRLHEGTLAYEGAENSEDLSSIKRAVASGKPVVVCMYMDRPAVLSEFLSEISALLADFSSDDSAILDIIFGRESPSGKLPFDLPRNMASVLKQRSDVPHDFEDPLFRCGHGLRYTPEAG
jgi:beta-glucosidase